MITITKKVVSLIKEEQLEKGKYTVKPAPIEEVRRICKEKHYLKRVPHIMAHYGLYKGELLMGVITFGIPPSPFLMKICGEEYKGAVLELNRLWCYDEAPRNSESFLISQGLKVLKKDRPEIKIIVSFADTRQGHLGYIYQATNWNFTGYSIPGGGSILIDGQEYHPKNLNNKYGTSDLNKLREILGTQNIFYRPRSKKCRYVYFLGTKKENQKLKQLCKYPIEPNYPKSLPKETEYKTKWQKMMDKNADGL